MKKIKNHMSERFVYPQELEVWYAIPSIRYEMTLEMKKRGFEQKEISRILGISEGAVSQYLSKKRAQEIKFNANLKKEIKKSVDEIIKDPKNLIKEVERIIDLPEIRAKLCNIHSQCSGSCEGCKVCG